MASSEVRHSRKLYPQHAKPALEFHSRIFRPNKSVIKGLSEVTLQKGIDEAESLFK